MSSVNAYTDLIEPMVNKMIKELRSKGHLKGTWVREIYNNHVLVISIEREEGKTLFEGFEVRSKISVYYSNLEGENQLLFEEDIIEQV